MKHIPGITIFILAFTLFVCNANAAPKPNIIVILADDLGYGELGCYGATKVKTPHLDKLAANGLRFTAAYAPASTCTPTRYALLTGEYAFRQVKKQTTILDGDAPLAIDPSQTTVPKILKKAGYATGVVGKWHLGLGDGKTRIDFNGEIKPGPLEVGFDSAYIIPATVDRVPSVWLKDRHVDNLDPNDPIQVSYLNNISDEPTGIERPDLLKQPADKQHACTIINGISRIGYMKGGKSARFKDEELADTVVEKSIAFMETHKDAPFFLLVGLFEPHVPRTPHPRFAGTSECGVRGDVIHQIDWQTGQIMDALDRLQLADDTLVLFTSDNGPVMFDGYFDNSVEDANGHQPAGPFSGWKYLVLEGGTRMPLIARWPGHLEPGQTTGAIVCLTDLMATAAALVEVTLPPGTGRDSINLLPAISGVPNAPVRNEVVQQGVSNAFALRQGDWKFIPANATGQASGIGSGANPDDTRFSAAIIREDLLFNLAEDPGETTNLAAKHPERLKAMAARLAQIKGK